MWTLSTYSDGRITLRMGTLYTRPPWTTVSCVLCIISLPTRLCSRNPLKTLVVFLPLQGCLIPLSFLCGIGAAYVVWKGGQKTKKTEQVKDKLRSALGIIEEEVDPTARLEEEEAKEQNAEESRSGDSGGGSVGEKDEDEFRREGRAREAVEVEKTEPVKITEDSRQAPFVVLGKEIV